MAPLSLWEENLKDVLHQLVTKHCKTIFPLFLTICVKICFHRFGCCSDGETPASGPDAQGCDENKSCENGPFGCCPDKRTFAQGPHKQGCFECPEEVRFVIN